VWRLTVSEIKEDVWSNLRDNFATYPPGAGLCIRRAVANRYLDWCAKNREARILDRSGNGLGGYGDMDLCQCAIDIGLGAGRSTKLKLTHLIPASRLTLDYFVRHAEGDAASFVLYRAIRGLPLAPFKSHSWFKEFIWQLHCLRRHVPREQRRIQAAYLGGLRRGIQMAEKLSSPAEQNEPCHP
jgi:hypothetical protein